MNLSYITHMGSDLEVVNDARVSFGKVSKWQEVCTCHYQLTTADERCHVCGHLGRDAGRLSKADANLIGFLARGCTSGDWDKLVGGIAMKGFHVQDWGLGKSELEDLVRKIRRMPTHWTPFAGSIIKLHVKVPIALANQFKRSEAGRVLNEVSRRYVDDEPEIYWPEKWRRRAASVKQGSSDDEARFPEVRIDHYGVTTSFPIEDVIRALVDAYNRAVDKDGDFQVCPEQARFVLPQSMYTEMRVTGSLYYWARVYTQRADAHAQREWRTIVEQMDAIIRPLFPVSWEALTQ